MHTASQAATQVYIKVQDHRSDHAGVNVELQTASTVYTFIGGSCRVTLVVAFDFLLQKFGRW